MTATVNAGGTCVLNYPRTSATTHDNGTINFGLAR